MEPEDLIKQIRSAFAGVALGNGVGIYEAKATSHYASAEEALRQRERDEKLDWQKVSFGDLNYCCGSIFYFDPEGMRFYLPAMMIGEMSGEYGHSVGDVIADPEMAERFVLFNQVQREAVISFLNWCLSDGNYSYEFGLKTIMEALLNGYWKES